MDLVYCVYPVAAVWSEIAGAALALIFFVPMFISLVATAVALHFVSRRITNLILFCVLGVVLYSLVNIALGLLVFGGFGGDAAIVASIALITLLPAGLPLLAVIVAFLAWRKYQTATPVHVLTTGVILAAIFIFGAVPLYQTGAKIIGKIVGSIGKTQNTLAPLNRNECLSRGGVIEREL